MVSFVATPPLGTGSLARIRALTAEFVDRSAPATRWGIYQGRDDGSPLSVVATWLERSVFHEAYGETEESLTAEFGPYADRTVWTVFVHHGSGIPVASTRCLVGPVRRQKFPSDLIKHWDLDWTEACAAAGVNPDAQFVECATFSVLREWRTADAHWPQKMAGATYVRMVHEVGASWASQVINPLARRSFARWGMPFLILAEATEIYGPQKFEATLSPAIPPSRWFHTHDAEFAAFFLHRSETVRGGIRWPTLDLDGSLARRLNGELFVAAGLEVPGPSCPAWSGPAWNERAAR